MTGEPEQLARPAIGKIAVGFDGSETARRALAVAAEMANGLGSDLVVGTAFQPISEHRLHQEDVPGELRWAINPTADAEAAMREAEEVARARGVSVTSEARTGDPARVLCAIAADHDADLLVVGNRGMQRKHLPSVPNTVSHRAPCSVLIVKTT